jgi:hypothetical protein
MFRIDGGGSMDDSELRFESRDTYAESGKLLVSTSILEAGALVRGTFAPLAGRPEMRGMGVSDASLLWVCHLVRRGRISAEGTGGAEVGGSPSLLLPKPAKCDVERLKAAPPRFASICLLKASNSGFASIGSCLGSAAAKDLTDDDGGLQLSRGMAVESRVSVVVSTERPK